MSRVFMTPEAIDRIVELCCGEPFLFQLAGERAWYAESTDIITLEQVDVGWKSAQPEARTHVERILQRLPETERKFLEAMAELPADERTLTRIARELG